MAVEKDSRPLHIVHITAEMAPIAKVCVWGCLVPTLCLNPKAHRKGVGGEGAYTVSEP